jgi:hypothetical protein
MKWRRQRPEVSEFRKFKRFGMRIRVEGKINRVNGKKKEKKARGSLARMSSVSDKVLSPL